MASMGTIVVTGVSGRIGMRVAERFTKAGYQVVGLDIVPPAKKFPRLTFFKTDLSSDESVANVFRQIKEQFGPKITSVIHLAAYYSFAGEHPELYDKITVKGTGRVLNAAKQFDCEQFFFSSTILLHAPCALGQKINEKWPVEGTWGYPESKVKTEKLMHEEHGKIPIVIFRIAGCYDDECHSIPISNHMQRIYEKQFICSFFPGDTSHGNPFLHLDDLTESIWLAVEKRQELPKEFTAIISEDVTMSYNEMQQELADLILGHPIPIHYIPKWLAKIGAWAQNHTPFMPPAFVKPWMIDVADAHYAADISLAKKVLGWKPKHFIKKDLPKMAEFLKADPIQFYRTNGLIMPRSLQHKLAKGKLA